MASSASPPHEITDYYYDSLGLSSDALCSTAKRHERTLTRINIEPLSTIGNFDEHYLYWFRQLFLLTFFYDFCLDRRDEEQFPEAFFISASMYADYRCYVSSAFGNRGLAILDEYNRQQLQYQTLENLWDFPADYLAEFPDYTDYYRKQVLCLTHLELMGLLSLHIDSNEIIKLYRRYWSLVLLIDDFDDADRDVVSKTLTPLSARYYKKQGRLPTINDVQELRDDARIEFARLYPSFYSIATRLNGVAFINLIDEMKAYSRI